MHLTDFLQHRDFTMRTTLAIDDNVLMAAKTLKQLERRTVGEVLSGLIWHGKRLGAKSLSSPRGSCRQRKSQTAICWSWPAPAMGISRRWTANSSSVQ